MRDLDDLCPSRRSVLRGLAALGGVALVPGVLVACSGGSDSGAADGTGGAGAGEGSAPGASVPVSDVPVGQARVVDGGGRSIVVAQPAEGEFVAFSAACTHQGTTVVAGDGLSLTCPNHGSQFDAADGAVRRGPAAAPLETVPVSVQGDQLVIG